MIEQIKADYEHEINKKLSDITGGILGDNCMSYRAGLDGSAYLQISIPMPELKEGEKREEKIKQVIAPYEEIGFHYAGRYADGTYPVGILLEKYIYTKFLVDEAKKDLIESMQTKMLQI